ncbi:MAG TPA: hypothetical protein VIH59_16345 [Candidatus Tectomicrobia bacterium]
MSDANLRYLYTGPQRPGPGCSQQYDGKVDWRGLSRFDRSETDAEGIVLYCQTVDHVQCKRNVRLVKGVDRRSNRSVVRCSTDGELSATTIYRYCKARFQVEFLFWEAKQFTGWSNCQARSRPSSISMARPVDGRHYGQIGHPSEAGG